MKVSFKLALNIDNKSLKIPKKILEENLKLWPYDKSGFLMTAFILNLLKTNSITEE